MLLTAIAHHTLSCIRFIHHHQFPDHHPHRWSGSERDSKHCSIPHGQENTMVNCPHQSGRYRRSFACRHCYWLCGGHRCEHRDSTGNDAKNYSGSSRSLQPKATCSCATPIPAAWRSMTSPTTRSPALDRHGGPGGSIRGSAILTASRRNLVAQHSGAGTARMRAADDRQRLY